MHRLGNRMRASARLACGGLLALCLVACDDTLPPIVDGGVADRGGSRDGPAADGARDAGAPADGTVVRDGTVSLTDRSAPTDGEPLPKDGCVQPSGSCSSDVQCKAATQVCSTSLGECLPDPCCPSCSVCFGTCVNNPQKLSAAITAAKAWRTQASGVSEVHVKVTLRYVNNHGTAVSNVQPEQSVLVAVLDPTAKTLPLGLKPTTPFSGTISGGQTIDVSYESITTGQAPFNCLEAVRVRTLVSYNLSGGAGTAEQIGPVLSPVVVFTCL